MSFTERHMFYYISWTPPLKMEQSENNNKCQVISLGTSSYFTTDSITSYY